MRRTVGAAVGALVILLSTGLLAPSALAAPRAAAGCAAVALFAVPASIDRPLPYPISEGRGVAALERAMTGYASRCPAALLTVVGYSQGADVASDLVHRSTNDATSLRPEQFAGVVLLGNPRRDPKGPNLVDAPGRGVLGPRPTRELEAFGGRVYEVCALGDPICATENFSLGVFREGLASGAHRSYPTLPIGPAGTPLYTVLGAGIDALVSAASGIPGPHRTFVTPGIHRGSGSVCTSQYRTWYRGSTAVVVVTTVLSPVSLPVVLTVLL